MRTIIVNLCIDELINILAGDQHEQFADIHDNERLHAPRYTGPNRQRQPRTNRTEIVAELEANPSRRLIFDIILRYLRGCIDFGLLSPSMEYPNESSSMVHCYILYYRYCFPRMEQFNH